MTIDEITQRFIDAYYKLYAMRVVKTKREFCEKCDSKFYPSNFALMERGDRTVSLRHIMGLITAFKVSLKWIFYGTGAFIDGKE